MYNISNQRTIKAIDKPKQHSGQVIIKHASIMNEMNRRKPTSKSERNGTSEHRKK